MGVHQLILVLVIAVVASGKVFAAGTDSTQAKVSEMPNPSSRQLTETGRFLKAHVMSSRAKHRYFFVVVFDFVFAINSENGLRIV